MKILLVLLSTLLVLSCNSQNHFDLEKERTQILKLHDLQRDFHFQKDSIAIANQLSDNFISVNRGEITYPGKEETISKFHHYFSSVEFLMWDDMTEPIIRFSEDGQLAYTIIDKIVRVAYEDENGELEESESRFAWTAIFRKYDGEWKIDCITSTDRNL